MGFSVAAAIRHHGVQNHPLRSRVGQIVTAQLRVTDDPRSVTGGRAMMRADLVGLGDPVQGMTGAVLVFGSSSLLGRVAVGDTVRARAAVARPGRRDLTVATLTVVAEPSIFGHSPIHGVANGIRDRFVDVSRNAL